MKQYKAYLFDWDGTLIQTLSVYLAVIRHFCEARGIHLSDQEISMGFGNWQYYEEKGVTDLTVFRQGILAEVTVALPKIPIYQGVLEMLQNLQASDRRLALISTSRREEIEANNTFHSLAPYFDTLVSGDMVKDHKPSPEGIVLALERLNIPKEQAVMLGDSDKGLGAAKNAGIESILFYPDSHVAFYDLDYLQTFEPTHIISDWNELTL